MIVAYNTKFADLGFLSHTIPIIICNITSAYGVIFLKNYTKKQNINLVHWNKVQKWEAFINKTSIQGKFKNVYYGMYNKLLITLN